MIDELFEANKEYREGNYNSAIQKYEKLAKSGNYGCARRLGHMYYSGQGVKKNNELAVNWLKLGVEVNDSYSLFLTSKIYLEQGHINASVEFLNKLVAIDYTPAMYRLGMLYLSDQGGNQIKRGVDLLIKAKSLGHMMARRNLGIYYLKDGLNPAQKIIGLYYFTSTIVLAFCIAIKNKHDTRLIS